MILRRLAAGVRAEASDILQRRSETARWLAAVRYVTTLPMASSPDRAVNTGHWMSPLAIGISLLSAACCLSGKTTTLRLLAAALHARPKFERPSYPALESFDDGEWKR